MNTASIKQGDVVECNVRGEDFMAIVAAKGRREDARLRPRELMVKTICQGRPRIVTARQVTKHWRRSGRQS